MFWDYLVDVWGSYLVDVLGDLVDVLGKVSGNKPDYWAIWWMFWENDYAKPVLRAIWWMFWEKYLVTSLITGLFGGCFGKVPRNKPDYWAI